jgi:uncharacterized membrane protein
MSIILKAVLAFLVVAHVAFFGLEWFWLEPWASKFREQLGFFGLQHEVAIVGKNQAFSNLVLAGGIVFSWVLWNQRRESANAVLLFFLVSIGTAGLVGFSTIQGDKKPFLLFQTLPAVLGIAVVLMGPLRKK